LRVVWHANARVGVLASEDHVAPGLATENKACAFERDTDMPARKVGGQF
jgi:hypothetical protein